MKLMRNYTKKIKNRYDVRSIVSELLKNRIQFHFKENKIYEITVLLKDKKALNDIVNKYKITYTDS